MIQILEPDPYAKKTLLISDIEKMQPDENGVIKITNNGIVYRYQKDLFIKFLKDRPEINVLDLLPDKNYPKKAVIKKAKIYGTGKKRGVQISKK